LLAPTLSELRKGGAETVVLVGYLERLAPLLEAGLADAALSLDRWLNEGKRCISEFGAGNWGANLSVDSFFPTVPKDLLGSNVAIRIHEALPKENSGIHVAGHLAESLGVRLPAVPTHPLGCLLSHRREGERPCLWIHPGAGSPAKRWPLSSFLEIAADWEERTGSNTRFLLGEAESELKAPIEKAGSRIELPPTLLDMARHFAGGDSFLGNDSGPGHLAALMGLRTVAVFASTDPNTWSPWGSQSRAIKPEPDEACARIVDILVLA
jgi:hypothetical protein